MVALSSCITACQMSTATADDTYGLFVAWHLCFELTALTYIVCLCQRWSAMQRIMIDMTASAKSTNGEYTPLQTALVPIAYIQSLDCCTNCFLGWLRLCCLLFKSAGSAGHWMWRKRQWQLLLQLLLSHPSMTLLRVSGTLPSVHSVLLLPRNRQQLPVVLEATRRGSINGMGQLLTRRDQCTGRLRR